MDTSNLVTVLQNLASVVFLVEAVTEIVKQVFKLQDERIILAVSIVTGIAVAFAANITILPGNTWQKVVGIILAGILASRGSNYLHEIINILQTLSGTRVAGKREKRMRPNF